MNIGQRIAILLLVFLFWAVLVVTCEAVIGEDIPMWVTGIVGGLTMLAIYPYSRRAK